MKDFDGTTALHFGFVCGSLNRISDDEESMNTLKNEIDFSDEDMRQMKNLLYKFSVIFYKP